MTTDIELSEGAEILMECGLSRDLAILLDDYAMARVETALWNGAKHQGPNGIRIVRPRLDALVMAIKGLRAAPADMVLVPREPTEEMWGGLARDIVWFLYSTSAPHRGVRFYKWLENMGREVPEWLLAEMPNVDHSPSKGTWAVCIFKAMLEGAAAPTAAAPADGADGEAV